MLLNVFEHKIEVIMSWQIKRKVLVPVYIPGIDITVSDFDCLPEKKNGKSRFRNFEKKKCTSWDF